MSSDGSIRKGDWDGYFIEGHGIAIEGDGFAFIEPDDGWDD